MGDNRLRAREPLFRAHGRHVESLGGRYITAEDVGTSTADMEFIRAETSHVTGLMGKSGDPSPVTAFGVYRGLNASPNHHSPPPPPAAQPVPIHRPPTLA